MERRVEEFIALMADVPVEQWDPRFRKAMTTMLHHAQPFTPKPTPSSGQEDGRVTESSTSLTNPASSAGTSSSELESHASSIETALANLGSVLQRKNSDYKVTSSEFSNFHFAADMAGLSAQDVMLAQIGIKLGRLRGLLDTGKDVNYEAIEDTVMDLAGYAVILYAYQIEMSR